MKVSFILREIVMFRELSRKNKEISMEDCINLLKSENRGVLSVIGDDNYPYGMPMNHFYCEEEGKIYFHCGKSGHRLDAIRRHGKVSFCTYDSGRRDEGEWALTVKSVIVFGKIEVIDDMDKIIDITTKLSRKFTDDVNYIKSEIEKYAHKTLLLRLEPEHICGKLVTES